MAHKLHNWGSYLYWKELMKHDFTVESREIEEDKVFGIVLLENQYAISY